MAGVGLFGQLVVGVQVPRIVLIVIPLVVVGWSIDHTRGRPTCPVGVKPPGVSDDHEELSWGWC